MKLYVNFYYISCKFFKKEFFSFLQYIQKKDPGYEDAKNDTVWSMEKFYEYIYEAYGEEKKLPDTIGKVIDVSLTRMNWPL